MTGPGYKRGIARAASLPFEQQVRVEAKLSIQLFLLDSISFSA